MKILVADNEKDFTEMLRERLAGKGHSVDVAYDGSAALELIKANNYDIMLLDHNMPGLTGLELAKYVKENGIRSVTVIVTGYEQMSGYFAKAVAADEYITKPVKLTELDAIIEKYKDRGPA